jgi:hypothetical protein
MILLVTAVFPPEPVVSANLSFDIAGELAKKHEVTVISPKPTRPFNKVFDNNTNKVIIMGGLRIGHGAIVGAGSIVTKDIPAYAVAAGVPAKVIRYRFEEPIIEKLLSMKWWNMSEEKLKKNIDLFQTENFSLSDLKRFED